MSNENASKSLTSTSNEVGALVKAELEHFKSALGYLRSENTRLKGALSVSRISSLAPLPVAPKNKDWDYDEETASTSQRTTRDKRDKTTRDRERVTQQLSIIRQEMGGILEESRRVRSVVRLGEPGTGDVEFEKQRQQVTSLGLAARDLGVRLRQATVPKKSKSAYRFKFFPPVMRLDSRDDSRLWGRINIPYGDGGDDDGIRIIKTNPIEMAMIHSSFCV